jgi:DNA-binding IclR family transcriptional regulator
MTPIGTNVGRRLQILTELLQHEADHGRGLGVVGLANAAGREKSQISRVLRTLVDAGLVERDPDSLEFVAGWRLLDLAGRAGQPLLLRRARPVCQRLATEVGERTHVAVAARHAVLTVESFAAIEPVQAMERVGQLHPYHSSATGQALLLDCPEEVLRERMASETPTFGGVSAPHTLAELQDVLAHVREVGFAVTEGEVDADPIMAAAPIRDAEGHVAAALAMSGPAARFRSRLPDLTPRLTSAAAAVSDALSAEGSSNAAKRLTEAI